MNKSFFIFIMCNILGIKIELVIPPDQEMQNFPKMERAEGLWRVKPVRLVLSIIRCLLKFSLLQQGKHPAEPSFKSQEQPHHLVWGLRTPLQLLTEPITEPVSREIIRSESEANTRDPKNQKPLTLIINFTFSSFIWVEEFWDVVGVPMGPFGFQIFSFFFLI